MKKIVRGNLVATVSPGVRMLVISGLLFATCCAASLQVDRLFRSQVKVSLLESEGPYFLEKSTNLNAFAAVSIFSNAVVLPATEQFSAFRAQRVSETALSYFERARLASPAAQGALNQWLTKLRDMGIWSNVVYMASFQTDYVGAFSSSIPAIVGSDAVPNKPVSFAHGGIAFDGSLFLAFTNPLPASVSELSVFAAFQSEPATLSLLLGNDAGEGRAGPAMWTGGDPYLFLDPENLSFTCSADGRVNGQPGFRAASTFNWGNQSIPQVALGSVSSNRIAMQVDIDREYMIPLTNTYPVANSGNKWGIGQRLDGTLPFKGTLFFAAIFNKQLGSNDLVQLRESYLASLGKSVAFPTTQLIIEGDSLSEEAFNTEYAHWLHDASNWKGKFVKRNIARFGETTSQMLDEFAVEVPAPVGERNYLFIWGGRNDLGFSTGAETFARLRTYWKRSRDLGYKVGAFTIIPAAYEKTTRLDIAVQRQELNRLIRAAAAEYDFLFDVDAITGLQDATNLTYFKTDGVHITGEASKLIADLINGLLKP